MNKFELNGVTYSQTEKGYYYRTTGSLDKKGNELTMRIAKHVFEQALDEWQKQADAEFAERQQKAIESDKTAEDTVNKWTPKNPATEELKKMAKAHEPKKASKPRKSKDVAYTTDWEDAHVTLTAKQADFIRHIPDTNFYEDGLESMVWCDILADEIGGQFRNKPMTVGAMISTLSEKNVISVGVERVNGKKAKFFGFTELGKHIASELGLN